MRKRIIPSEPQESVSRDRHWLNLEDCAVVEVTSEEPAHPIEAALLPGRTGGWRAADPGRQTIRLVFDRHQQIERIRLHFEEPDVERTQEYVLRWSADGGRSYHEFVRQQWNFSPGGSMSQIEEHRVELPAASVVELTIVPDIRGGEAHATLRELRLA